MSVLLTSSNADYHGNKTHLSSSNLKLILKDPAKFHHEWVLGHKKVEEDTTRFDIGSLFHSLILEPHELNQYAIYPGLRKYGAEWDRFQVENRGKIILSISQENVCKRLADSVKEHKVASNLLTDTLREHTMLTEILDVPIKTRADAIKPGRYIIDLKSTNMESSADLFRHSVDQFGYGLSAALYCQAAFDNYGELHDFIWIVTSKKDYLTRVYKASSTTLSIGAAEYTQALVRYKSCLKTGIWTSESVSEFSEEIEEV